MNLLIYEQSDLEDHEYDMTFSLINLSAILLPHYESSICLLFLLYHDEDASRLSGLLRTSRLV